MFAASKTDSASTGGYQIQRSLRFNAPDSAYLNRTPASAGNRKTWTWSGWVKRGTLGTLQTLFGINVVQNDSQAQAIFFGSDDKLKVIPWTDNNFVSNAVFRDPSAWYHIVVAFDSTNATANNRVIVYVNNVNQSGTYPLAVTLNADYGINQAGSHRLGDWPASGFNTFGGYMTEINFIDGQALTPSSFGETNAQTGVWQPKAYSGSYGTNGFYLNFSDNSNTTAATLGKDYSGNGNNWTPNNFSVTAGAGNDSLVDSPTSYGTDTGVGGTVRGNYCTLNPLFKNGTTTAATLANGNLDLTTTGGVDNYFGATFSVSSGKWYYECLVTAVGSGFMTGICKTSAPNGVNIGSYRNTSEIYNLDGTAQTSGATYTANDLIGVAIDIDSGTVQFYKNGTAQGATPSFTFTAGTEIFVRGRSDGSGATATFNFGQRPFAYTAPSGFKALCTQNLPTPTIGATTATQAGKYFNPVLYTGNGGTQSVTGVGFQPDFVWIKKRNSGGEHVLDDAVRGAGKGLFTNLTNAENASMGGFLSFDSDGWSMNGTVLEINQNALTYVGWNWKANGSGSTNTAGQITSTVSANTTSGFSIVTFTTDGTTKTVGHGLGVKPSLIIAKVRSGVGSWIVMTDIINGSMQYGTLNTTNAFASIGYSAPTSTVFQYNDNNGNTQVAYCFAPIAGYSAFGTYTGNGSTNFIYTGFRPAYVLIRRTNVAAGWGILDSARNSFNSANKSINANVSDAEGVGTAGSQYVDLLSNGFKCLDSSAGFNASGDTYIYMAFAESPFKYSLAR